MLPDALILLILIVAVFAIIKVWLKECQEIRNGPPPIAGQYWKHDGGALMHVDAVCGELVEATIHCGSTVTVREFQGTEWAQEMATLSWRLHMHITEGDHTHGT